MLEQVRMLAPILPRVGLYLDTEHAEERRLFHHSFVPLPLASIHRYWVPLLLLPPLMSQRLPLLPLSLVLYSVWVAGPGLVLVVGLDSLTL